MAIALEFIDFVVPIATIRKKYPGGWTRCLRDHGGLIGGRAWYDDNLFRDGAMSPMDIEHIVKRWEGLGFEPFDETSGARRWKDMCVVESLLSGPTLPCNWLDFDPKERIAYLRGTEPGPIIGRDHFQKGTTGNEIGLE